MAHYVCTMWNLCCVCECLGSKNGDGWYKQFRKSMDLTLLENVQPVVGQTVFHK